MTAAPSGTFRTGDGLLNIAANKQEQFVKLCELIGRPDLATDPRFAERETRKRNRYALNPLIEAALAGASAAEWEIRLNRAGVPAGRVLSIPDTLREPQIVERGMMTCFESVEGLDRPLTVVRGGFLIDAEAPAPARPPPRLGEHQAEIIGPAAAEAAR